MKWRERHKIKYRNKSNSNDRALSMTHRKIANFSFPAGRHLPILWFRWFFVVPYLSWTMDDSCGKYIFSSILYEIRVEDLRTSSWALVKMTSIRGVPWKTMSFFFVTAFVIFRLSHNLSDDIWMTVNKCIVQVLGVRHSLEFYQVMYFRNSSCYTISISNSFF